MDGNIEKMQSLTGKIKSLAIDKTLTKKGMCAEAEATGKALAKKVNTADIVDELTSVAEDKPLSANQGRLLKKQIDEIDPHNAENVIYGDTNVKNALDGVCGDIDDVVRTIGYTASKNILGLASIVGKTITHNGVSITNTSQNVYTINGTPTTATWFELGFDFRIDTVAKESPFVKLNSSKSYTLSIEQEGSVSYGTITDGDDTTVFNITGVGEVNDKHRLYIQKGETSLLVNNESGFTRLYMIIPKGATFNNYVLKIQLEEGTEATEFEPYVEDVQTQLDNSKINSSTTSLINTNLSASENAQTITINNYNNYNGLYIVFRPSGDMTNGEHFFVPKCLFGLAIPFTVDSSHNFDDVYTCRTHGYVKDGVINFNKLKCKGWTFMQVLVIGLK